MGEYKCTNKNHTPIPRGMIELSVHNDFSSPIHGIWMVEPGNELLPF